MKISAPMMDQPEQNTLRRPGRPRQAGFTLIELAIIMVVAGILLVPLLRMAGSAVVSTRLKSTQSTLETASEALISFAAMNGGCLPFAADFEGGLIDTDASGSAASSPDTGIGVNAKHGGDLPWADLGLSNDFLDGKRLRIQYYVATPYTGSSCAAGFRGFPYNMNVTYTAPALVPLWLYATPTAGSLTLYQLAAGATLEVGGTPSDDVPAADVDVTGVVNPLPNPLLQVLKGPDITSATDGQNAVVVVGGQPQTDNLQNVFVLIAPGPNRNILHNRTHVRDRTHTGDASGSSWSLDSSNLLDVVVFSSEPNVDTTDSANNGDDTLLNMTFEDFQKEMSKFGLHMEALCETSC